MQNITLSRIGKSGRVIDGFVHSLGSALLNIYKENHANGYEQEIIICNLAIVYQLLCRLLTRSLVINKLQQSMNLIPSYQSSWSSCLTTDCELSL